MNKLPNICCYVHYLISRRYPHEDTLHPLLSKMRSVDSDQTARTHRLIWIFAWRTCPMVCFLIIFFMHFFLFQDCRCFWVLRQFAPIWNIGRSRGNLRIFFTFFIWRRQRKYLRDNDVWPIAIIISSGWVVGMGACVCVWGGGGGIYKHLRDSAELVQRYLDVDPTL